MQVLSFLWESFIRFTFEKILRVSEAIYWIVKKTELEYSLKSKTLTRKAAKNLAPNGGQLFLLSFFLMNSKRN